MRYIFSFLSAFLISFSTIAQIEDPVEWRFDVRTLEDNQAELVVTANIDPGWHLYSQFVDGGPVATSFTFFDNPNIELIGKVIEGEAHEEFDPNFETILKFFDTEAIFRQSIKLLSEDSIELKGELQFMTCNDAMCLPPEWVDISVVLPAAKDINVSLNPSRETKTPADGLASLFWIAFLSGFVALLTPCVFPMIPMTVSFFTKQSHNKAAGIRNAIVYGLSIIGIYVVLGVAVSAIFGADTLNNMATNVYFNIAFFILLLVFAASFLGAFEITMPNSWINKSDSASDRGGLIGIFFMAFTLALVSFSCTGPIVGTLLVEAASGGSYVGPVVGMFGFSLAIALPFTLFAAFPGWLNSLPKSGGWLNSVKVVLGFLELALAFKFLSNADLVMQTHLLEREVFIAIWIVIFAMLTLYLLGKLKLSHDSDMSYVSVSRLFLALVTGAFTVYMIPGLWGAPLKLINAFPPPMYYSESPYGVGNSQAGSSVSHDELEGQHLGPQGIMVFHDYETGLAYAKSVNKPIMLDFTGWACVNCRKMEEQVWSDPGVRQILAEDMIIISLYVDERTVLAKEDQYETTIVGKKKKVRTVGDRWMVMQTERYDINSQPYYLILDHQEKSLVEAANYQNYGSVDIFKDWLSRGLAEYNK
ncbi:MAG: thiol:disulfide interchange protein [Flavobacteriales bacterium]|nr:thiol:disulfide interchange protein [Flavobacteriales bacterium]